MRIFQPRLSPTRDAANVVADAVEAAKAEKLAQANAQLRDARAITHGERARLHVVMDDVHDLWVSSFARMSKDIMGGC